MDPKAEFFCAAMNLEKAKEVLENTTEAQHYQTAKCLFLAKCLEVLDKKKCSWLLLNRHGSNGEECDLGKGAREDA